MAGNRRGFRPARELAEDRRDKRACQWYCAKSLRVADVSMERVAAAWFHFDFKQGMFAARFGGCFMEGCAIALAWVYGLIDWRAK